MDKLNTPADRFRTAREKLGLTQQQLADRLLISRNYVAQIESGNREPSVRILSSLESLFVDSANIGKTRSRSAGLVMEGEDRGSGYGLADPDSGVAGRPMPNRHDCEQLLKQVLDAAEREGSPENIPVIFHRLKRQFPLDEWKGGG